MGYRSQVRCLIYGEPDKLDAFIMAHRMILGSSVFSNFTEDLAKYKAKFITGYNAEKKETEYKTIHVLDLHGNGWKWSEDYEDVTAWHSFMDEAPGFGLNFEFIRIGEEYDDVDRQEGGDEETHAWYLHVSSPSIEESIYRLEDLVL